MHTYIYFVGKPYPHRASLEKVRALGYKLGIFLDKNAKLENAELFEHVISLDFSRLDTLIPQLQNTPPLNAAGLICTYENYILAKAVLDDHLQTSGNTFASAQLCTDKLLMRQAFLQADPAITPRFAAVESEAQVRSFARRGSYPLFIKPTNLVKSLLVLHCANETELINNYRYIVDSIEETYKKYNIYDRQPQIIVEEGIVGDSYSVAAFVDANGTPHFCPAITQLTPASEKGIADNYLYERSLPASMDQQREAKILKAADIGIRALNMKSTPAHVELIYDRHRGVQIVEIGARIGGYRPLMYRQSYGIDLIEQEVRVVTGQQPTLSGSLKAYTKVYELFPDHTGAFSAIEGDIRSDSVLYYRVKATPGQIIGPAKNGFKAAAIIAVSEPDIAALQSTSTQIDALHIKVAS